MAVDDAKRRGRALCLVGCALAVVGGCRASPMAEQCKTLSMTVNDALDKVEALYKADAPTKTDWEAIAVAYDSLSQQLKSMKLEDQRLVAATTEYQTTLALTAQTTRSLASASKRKQKRAVKKHLEELAAHAAHHKRLSQRIDQLCQAR